MARPIPRSKERPAGNAYAILGEEADEAEESHVAPPRPEAPTVLDQVRTGPVRTAVTDCNAATIRTAVIDGNAATVLDPP